MDISAIFLARLRDRPLGIGRGAIAGAGKQVQI